MTLVSTIQSQYHTGQAYGLSVPPSPFTPTTDPAAVSITPSTEPFFSDTLNKDCSEVQTENSPTPVTSASEEDNVLFLCNNSTSDHGDDIKTKARDKTRDQTTADIKNVTKGSTKFVFINSYWTDNTILGGVAAGSASGQTSAQSLAPVVRAEVGPGEGESVLAITLVNRGFVALTSVTGELKLPSGFQSVVSAKNKDSSVALSSFPTTEDQQVDPGQTFTLYFPIKILENTKVGKIYNADLNIHYLKVTDESKTNLKIEKSTKERAHLEIDSQCTDNDSDTNRTRTNIDRNINAKTVHTPFDSKSQSLQILFQLSGKVILDVIGISESTAEGGNLSSPPNTINILSAAPGIGNRIKLVINNVGSASATGVIATVSGRTESTTSNNIIRLEMFQEILFNKVA